MRFSIFLIAMGKHRKSNRDVYEQMMRDVQMAEDLDFDTVWFAEHHFREEFSLSPSPNLFLAAAANCTERIKLGVAVNVLPFYSPIRLAEEGAMLDVMSEGRFQWGIGRGIAGAEFAPWGIDPATSRERFVEIHDSVISSWTTSRIGYEGAHYVIPDADMVPTPLQQPHPPVWVTAQSPDSVRWAAQHGYPAMQVGEPLERGSAQLALYREAAAEHGVSIDPERGAIVPLRYVYVARTDAAAREACAPLLEEFWENFSRIAQPGRAPSGAGYDYWRDRTTSLEQYRDYRYEELLEAGIIITGSPDTVIEAIKRQEEALDCRHLMCDFWRTATAPAERAESMRLFASEVMPEFQPSETVA